ncbi:MAG: AAA domain-containing protein [Winogradskyella sp.]|uniref:AAA family ATPase n=1 Tax=Winogradskyella sp. TaxID=1883156 RepID=UPI001823659F|nr:AAA domain-containing protein [Winogradskyella sp.]
MEIKDYVKKYNLSFDKVKSEFDDDFKSLYESEKEWLENLEDKVHLLKNKKDQAQVTYVINKLKSTESFNENDSKALSTFVSKVNTIVKIANRINNFKEGTVLDNGTTLKLYDFFNSVKNSDNLSEVNYLLNSNLNNFLPHIFSLIKHSQNPIDYPIYYKFWKNILREVLSKDDDYDSMCTFYRNFPSKNRHLNFATYLGTLGTQIAKNINSSGMVITAGSKDYKYLINEVINIERYNSILDDQLTNSVSSNKQNIKYWLYAPGENARKWNELFSSNEMAIGWDDLNDLSEFSSKEKIEEALMESAKDGKRKYNNALACYEFASVIKPGDIVITKKGKREYVGWGIVTGEYFYDSDQTEYKHRRKVDWKRKGEWIDGAGDIVTKTLTDITKYPDYVKRLTMLLGIDKKENSPMGDNVYYPLNTILYGPPGTGKTYSTILRASEIIENKKIDSYDEAFNIFNANLHKQIEFITFHQNYSYEDFIQGLRPETDNKSSLVFDKIDGVFKKIADKALENLKLAQKAPEELSSEAKFDKALELFSDKVLESEDNFKINDTAYIFEVEGDAYRYTGEKWTNHTNGLRMKYSDLKEFYRNSVKSRKDIKSLSNISGLANQHATYYYLVYAEILKHLPKKAEGAQKVNRKNFVIIIDEINRANISRVFGELITLIEPDKRSHGAIPLEARLPSGDPFIVPSNLYIIGTMNTADKSIALLDIALRRRFEFESMYPKYEIENQEIYDVDILKKINEQIIKSKGHDFQIGHAYFMGENKNLLLRMNKKVIPLLLEYYMNDEKEVKGILQSAGLIIEENSWPLRIKGTND